MTFDVFKTEIKSADYPVREAEFPKARTKEQAIKPPFICFFRGADKSIYVGGKPVIYREELTIELYTERDDTTSEKVLETFLREKDIPFKKTERAWITSEKFYVSIYKCELL